MGSEMQLFDVGSREKNYFVCFFHEGPYAAAIAAAIAAAAAAADYDDDNDYVSVN